MAERKKEVCGLFLDPFPWFNPIAPSETKYEAIRFLHRDKLVWYKVKLGDKNESAN